MNLWISWEIETGEAEQKQWETLCSRVAEACLQEEHIAVPIEVSLTVSGEEAIRDLNRDYRETDRVTDVLSFPQWELSGEGAAAELEETPRDPDTDAVCLGDIVICLPRAREQAQEYGHSLERELGFLTAHSMLHLLGYDHMEAQQEKQMMDKQEAILSGLGLFR